MDRQSQIDLTRVRNLQKHGSVHTEQNHMFKKQENEQDYMFGKQENEQDLFYDTAFNTAASINDGRGIDYGILNYRDKKDLGIKKHSMPPEEVGLVQKYLE